MRDEQLGLDLRDAALKTLEERRKSYVREARVYAHYYIRQHGSVTVDDIRKALPPSPDFDARVLGAVLIGRQFKKIGDTHTTRPSSHHRPIGIFGLAS